MKHIHVALLILAGVISIASANGVAEEQNKDRTGSPDGTNTCVQCHMDGGFSPTVSITLENAQAETVTSVSPGETYNLRVSVENFFPFPDVYGFQATALLADLSNAGVFSEPGVNVQIENVDNEFLSNRHVVEHNGPSPVGNFTVNWTAPLEGDSVYFYAAGVTGNGNNEPEGDNGHNSALTLPLIEPDGIEENSLTAIQINKGLGTIEISHPTLSVLDEVVIHSIAGRELYRSTNLGLPFVLTSSKLNRALLVISLQSEGRYYSFKTTSF